MTNTGGGKPGYRSDIDGLRAVAVLAVMFFHAGLGFPGGFVGVDIFFVISGYLITRLIISALERGTFTCAGFWTRRLKRIWPAASAMTIATLIAGFIFLGPGNYHELATDAIPQAIMLANVQFARGVNYFHPAMDRRILLHTWSLAVEEQFYLFYPFLLVILWRRYRRLLLACLTLIAVLSLLLSALTINAYPAATFYLLHARAWELLLGGILSQLSLRTPDHRVYSGSLILLAVPLTLAPMFLYSHSTTFPGLAAVPPCLGTAMLIHLGTNPRNLVTRFLAWEPMRRIGLISYSLYLVHWPILVFMRNYEFPSEPRLSWRIFAVAISFPIAYLSWRFIEQRFRNATPGPHPFRNAAIRSFAVSMFIVIASLGIRATGGVDLRFSGQILAHIKPKQIPHHWQIRDTSSTEINRLTTPLGGVKDPTDSSPPCFFFWGDSHAMALCDFIDEQAKSLGISGLARIRTGTTPVPRLWSDTSGKDASEANERILQWLVETHIQNVILCSRWSVQVDGRPTGSKDESWRTLVSSLDEPLTHDPRAARHAFEEALSQQIARLEGAGITIWILTEVPYQDNSPQQRAIKAWLHRTPLPRHGVTRQTHDIHIRNTLIAIESAASAETHIIPLADGFFDETGASQIADEDGHSYYADDDHANDLGAGILIAPTLLPVLEAIANDCKPST